jgi:DNA repair protein RecO (recombination protein O)
MASAKATAIVLKTTDWSESSRIATFWTREFGKVRALAKGGRRLKSAFESALDLLTVCSIVFLRKSPGTLDLLTEAQVVQRFPRLRDDLDALYAAYYVAELLTDWTEEYDPHPLLFDEALETLRDLGCRPMAGAPGVETGPRVMRFEMALLRELGYNPALDVCAVCASAISRGPLAFSAAAGGVLCGRCLAGPREKRALSRAAWEMLRAFAAGGDEWKQPRSAAARAEVRQLLGHYVTYLMGRRPRLLPYLGS